MITSRQDTATGASLHEVTGAVRPNEIAEALMKFDPLMGPRHLVWDLRAADLTGLLSTDIGFFVTVCSCSHGKAAGCRMAWIVPFGAAAAMLEVALSPIRATGIEYRFFDCMARARSWISEAKPAGAE